MTKSVEDFASLMVVLVDPLKRDVHAGESLLIVPGAWEGIRIGAPAPLIWTFHELECISESAAETQMVNMLSATAIN